MCCFLRIPEDLRGRRVLDVGAFDGGLSFACERRGADEVVALDVVKHETFAFAHTALESKVRFEAGNAYDLDPARLGTFDLVIFAGVLYHLRYPLLGLDRLRAVATRDVHVETHTARLPLRRAAAVFYERDELNGDYTNWFGPNDRAVRAWFRSAGFTMSVALKATPRTHLLFVHHVAPTPSADLLQSIGRHVVGRLEVFSERPEPGIREREKLVDDARRRASPSLPAGAAVRRPRLAFFTSAASISRKPIFTVT